MKKKDENEDMFKLITVGDSNVGKTSIIRRYIYNVFDKNSMSTIGISFCFKEICLENKKKIKLKVLDTAGQEKYNSLTKSYFKNADGVLFVFDLNRLESFENIENWINLYEQNNNRNDIPKYLIGNKSDLEKNVEKKKIDEFIKKYNYNYEECSALDNINIDNIFQKMGEQIYNNYLLREKDQKNIKVTEFVEEKEKKINKCVCVFD